MKQRWIWLFVLLLSSGIMITGIMIKLLKTSCFGEMHVTQSTIGRLFDDGIAFVHQFDGQESFNMYCHIVEGSWCYFIEHEKIESYDGHYDPAIDNESHQIDREFAR